MRRRFLFSCISLIFLAAAPAVAQQVLKREPASGTLKSGATVLVDDGTCPAGQIKQVTGGSNMGGGTRSPGSGASKRQTRCVPR